MLREALFKGARHHGGKLAPFFLLLGIGMLCLLPVLHSQKIYIDENAVGQMRPSVKTGPVTAYLDPTVHWPQRLVRGRRSPGSEIVAVYVNIDYPASVSLANALIEVIRHRKTLACDVQFYFVNSTEEWPVPKAYTRAALVLNLSTLYNQHVCIDTLGENGIQPNQDYTNSALQFFTANGFVPSYLCQRRHRSTDDPRFGFWHYWAYLETSLQLSTRPQPWHTIPTHSINTIAISSDPSYSEDSTLSDSQLPDKFARLVMQIIVSLNGLEEKFHHSTFVWLPVSPWIYVEYDHAQFCTILFVASIFSTAYSDYQLSDVSITPLGLTLLVTPVAAAAAFQVAGWWAVAAVSVALSMLFRLFMAYVHSGVLFGFNAIVLCLMIILQPACGLVAGAAAAIQVFFLQEALRNRFAIVVGTVVSSALVYYFIYHLQLPLIGVGGISELFVSFVIYPNAVWSGSRLLSLLY
ncbi:GPI transamidase component GAA1, putative [Leishmania tarentolae]|uniref:GPI transamidase component GAA1, putative n=1 Tax=Leishmania tarentolae TaxID=5689 RepID=A0A640KFH0_LEITA|nr:GPI transamidase component GAA1, putative [Leishmania tarentolae]